MGKAPKFQIPKVTPEYQVWRDTWYRGVNGKKITYVQKLDAVNLEVAQSFVDSFHADENPRIMQRFVSDWHEAPKKAKGGSAAE